MAIKNNFGLPDALMHQLEVEGWLFQEIETCPVTREIRRPDGSPATVQEAIEACEIVLNDEDPEHEETEVDRILDTINDISEFYDWDANNEVFALAAFLDYLAGKQGVSSEALRLMLREYLDEFGKAGG